MALVSQTFFSAEIPPIPALFPRSRRIPHLARNDNRFGAACHLVSRELDARQNRAAPICHLRPVIHRFVHNKFVCVRTRFDRYMLPNLLLLILLAALGWALIIAPRSPCRQRLLLAAVALLTVAFAVQLALPLYAANWLAGGRQTAAKTIPTGWGETASAAARWAGEQTGRCCQCDIVYGRCAIGGSVFPGETIRLDEMRVGEIEPNDFVMLPDDEGDFSSPVHLVTIGGDRMAVYTGMMPDHIEASPLQLQPLSKRFDTLAQLEWAGWRLAGGRRQSDCSSRVDTAATADGVVQIRPVGP